MSLEDDVNEALGIPPRGMPGDCSVCWQLEQMSADDREAAEYGLKHLSAGKIATIMSNNGHSVSKSSVLRHLTHSRQEPTTA